MISPGLMRAVAAERERAITREAGRRRPAPTHDAPRTALLRGRVAFKALRAADTNGARP